MEVAGRSRSQFTSKFCSCCCSSRCALGAKNAARLLWHFSTTLADMQMPIASAHPLLLFWPNLFHGCYQHSVRVEDRTLRRTWCNFPADARERWWRTSGRITGRKAFSNYSLTLCLELQHFHLIWCTGNWICNRPDPAPLPSLYHLFLPPFNGAQEACYVLCKSINRVAGFVHKGELYT